MLHNRTLIIPLFFFLCALASTFSACSTNNHCEYKQACVTEKRSDRSPIAISELPILLRETTDPEEFLYVVDVCLQGTGAGHQALHKWYGREVVYTIDKSDRLFLVKQQIGKGSRLVRLMQGIYSRAENTDDVPEGISTAISTMISFLNANPNTQVWSDFASFLKVRKAHLNKNSVFDLAYLLVANAPSNANDFRFVFADNTKDKSRGLMLLAASALTGEKSALEQLASFCKAGDKESRRRAIRLMTNVVNKNVSSPILMKELKLLLKDKDPVIRFWAAIVAGNAGVQVEEVSLDEKAFLGGLIYKAKSANFEVHSSHSKGHADWVDIQAENAIKSAEGLFGAKWSLKKVDVFVLSDQALWECYRLKNLQSMHSRGCWDSMANRIYLLGDDSSIQGTIQHEVFHAAMDCFLKQNDSVPRYFEEGLAYSFQGNASLKSDDAGDWRSAQLWWALCKNEFIEFDALKNAFAGKGSEQKLQLVLLEGESFVKFLVSTHNSELKELLNELRKGRTFDKAVAIAFKGRYAHVWKRWKDSLKAFRLPISKHGPLDYMLKHGLEISISFDIEEAVGDLFKAVKDEDIENQKKISGLIDQSLERKFEFDITADKDTKIRQCIKFLVWLGLNEPNLIWSKEKKKLVLAPGKEEIPVPVIK